jgi:hypothetical protein
MRYATIGHKTDGLPVETNAYLTVGGPEYLFRLQVVKAGYFGGPHNTDLAWFDGDIDAVEKEMAALGMGSPAHPMAGVEIQGFPDGYGNEERQDVPFASESWLNWVDNDVHFSGPHADH